MPALEWDETAIKFEPMIEALEAGGARFDDRARVGVAGPATDAERS